MHATFLNTHIAAALLIAATPLCASAEVPKFEYRSVKLGLRVTPDYDMVLEDLRPPAPRVGLPYVQDFREALTLSGKAAPSKADVSWTLTGTLPAGLKFDTATGILSGTATAESAAASYTLTATYRQSSVSKSFSIGVLPGLAIVNQGAYRTWGDGTFAPSCKGYREPSSGHVYAGAVGDGIYRIQPPGQAPTDVYCDMAGGGYTLLGKAVALSFTTAWGVTATALNVSASPSPSTGTTFKHSEAFINALPKTVYRVQSTRGYATTRFWDGRCEYKTFQAASAYCWTSFSNEALTTGTRYGSYNGGFGGLHDHTASGGYYIATQIPTAYGWGGGEGSSGIYTGTGSAGTLITLVLWAK